MISTCCRRSKARPIGCEPRGESALHSPRFRSRPAGGWPLAELFATLNVRDDHDGYRAIAAFEWQILAPAISRRMGLPGVPELSSRGRRVAAVAIRELVFWVIDCQTPHHTPCPTLARTITACCWVATGG